ncbi:glycerol-3-phosphate dehydrogenase [Motiliproteus sediminis]|uniref:glycerol-3-phosphate dehydrogenase n=1 Tax=Motiliproteus sediminis TaxID=1468178 RepID=UPI001AEF3D9F|nr:glycerol-3-phosphate dehydrogenase [Motiliproteus sediminis]
MQQPIEVDLAVIGGGINGTGIAMEAARRGLKVLLCEQGDLAEGTSSRSSKLIHGGLRYLEHGHFRLVREALSERERLLQMAPHLIWPLLFRLPLADSQRPAWMLRLGLFLYDHLGRRNRLPASRRTRFGDSALHPRYDDGFEYADAWVDDARLVVSCARQAARDGARVLTRHRCSDARRDGSHWRLQLTASGTPNTTLAVRAQALVNAAGPWVESCFKDTIKRPSPHPVRLVKGSHLVVPALSSSPHAYLLQHPQDQRVVFVLPYETDYSLIGTTEIIHQGDPATANVSDDEVDYLLQLVNRHFVRQLGPDDIRHHFAGVRPLLDDRADSLTAISRDYLLELDAPATEAPLLSVFGGKLTSFRALAERALQRLAPHLTTPLREPPERLVLPGGDFDNQRQLYRHYRHRYPWLPMRLLRRWVRSYGTEINLLLGDARHLEDLGALIGADLYLRELAWMRQQEWAHTAEDILWRRSKLGLRFSAAETSRLIALLEQPVDL